MTHFRFISLLLQLLLLPFCETFAASGAHIVDDSEIEDPGKCHLDVWGAFVVPGYGYFNASPACTLAAIPWLEVGATYQHFWDELFSRGGFGPAVIGPQIKINFQKSSKEQPGFGLNLNSGVNLATGDLELASLTALATIQITDEVRLNLNAGWSYVRGVVAPDALFYGAQFEADVRPELSLMIEMFGRTQGTAGGQFGLRYTPGGKEGRFDFDLLVGSTFGEENVRFFTFGVTVRF